MLDNIWNILNNIDSIPSYDIGYYWYYYTPFWKEKSFYVKAYANYWADHVYYNIVDPDQHFRMIYQWKFKHKLDAFKFIDNHYDRLIN